MPLITMAWRNMRRGGRRSAVTIAAMAFGLWTMVLYSGLVTGYIAGMEEDVLAHEVGEVQIHAPGYLDTPNLYDRIEDDEAVLSALEAAGLDAAPRVITGGLAAADEASAGVQIRGIDLVRDPRVLDLHGAVARGDWLAADAPTGAVIGRRLARTLGVDVGDEVVVLTQGADGSMANALYVVRGVLGPVSDGTDRTAILLPMAAVRELLVLPEGAHQIIVRGPGELAVTLAAAEQAAAGLDVRSWRRLMPTIASMLDSSKSILVFVFATIYLAIGILVLNAVLMAVFERIREFGVMKAIGVGPWQVFAVIFLETAMQLGVAVVIGLIAAIPVGWWLATTGIDVGALGGTSVMGLTMKERWIAEFGIAQVTTPLAVLSTIVMAAAVWPAAKAARIHPVDAMRHT